jgi:hypothetical protein
MPFSVFTNQIPAILDVNAVDHDVTLGMQWFPEYDGVVRGARFYLGNRNFDGYQVIGVLYQFTKTTALAQKARPITAADAIGWVNITFDQPIIVRRNQAYVIGVWFPGQETLPGGKAHYVATSGFFTASGIDNPPLHAYKNDTVFNLKLNGVYGVGATPTYPVSTNGASYFVDVIYDYIVQARVRVSGAWVSYPIKARTGGSWKI